MLDSHEQVPVDLLADEYVSRLRQGESVDVEQYASRWPDLADEIRELFPAVEAMERLKRRKQREADHAKLPTKIGDFRVLREIGRGGMGIVYEAVQESLDRRVALKVLPQAMWNERRLRRFRREARTAAKLHHTNIVPVLGVGEDDGHHFIVMQYIRGVGLDDVISAMQRMPASESSSSSASIAPLDSDPPAPQSADSLALALARGNAGRTAASADPIQRQAPLWHNIGRLGAQAAEALDYAHQQGTTHRDIKPGNLLLDVQGNIWVADFGLAIEQEASHSHDIVGTLRYMAPEQLRGESDQRSDVYSLGITLYELATRQPAFDDKQRREQLIHGKPFEPPPTPSSICSCPRDLETIILKATAIEPRHRYQTAGEFADDLHAFIEHRPIRARRVTSAERLLRWCRRNKALSAALGAAALLLIAVTVTATVAYYQTRALALRAQNSLRRETQQRERAEATLEISLEALDRIYRRFAPDRFRDTTATVRRADELDQPRAPITPGDAAMLEEILLVYDRFAEQQANSRRLAMESARANWRVAEIQRRLGHYDRAAQACLRAIQQYQRLDSLPTAPSEAPAPLQPPQKDDVQLALARVYNELGMTRLAEGRRSLAIAAHEQALEHLGALPEETPPTREASFETARTDYLLMLAHPERSRKAIGKRLQRAIPLLESMAETEVATGDARYLLAVCYAAREADPFGPLTEEAIDLLDQLVCEFPQRPDYRFDLISLCSRGDLNSMFQQKRLEERLRRALKHSRLLVKEHPNVRNYVQTHAHVLRRLGALLSHKAETLVDSQQRKVRRESEELLRLAVDHQTTLSDHFPDEPAFRICLARIQNLLARHLVQMQKHREAQGVCDRVVGQLYGLPPNQTHALLADTYTVLADARTALGELGEAADAKDNALFHSSAAQKQAVAGE